MGGCLGGTQIRASGPPSTNTYQTALYVMRGEYRWLNAEGPSGLLPPPSMRHREEGEEEGGGGWEKKFGDEVDIQNAHFTQDQSATPNEYLEPVNIIRRGTRFVDAFAST